MTVEGSLAHRFLKAPMTTPFRHPPERRATRWVIRATLTAMRHRIAGLSGVSNLRALDGPFVAVLNHSQRAEAFLVPALLGALRGGRIIRFLADWNFMLLPPVFALYRAAQVIPVTSKPARPAFLTPLRSWLAPAPSGIVLARSCLQQGQPVGVFVEGTVNRNPRTLLRGRRGAARLCIEAGVPALPIGIRFPDHSDPDQPIEDREPLSVHIGEPIPSPPSSAGDEDMVAVRRSHHAALMHAVAELSHTRWTGRSNERPSRRTGCTGSPDALRSRLSHNHPD